MPNAVILGNLESNLFFIFLIKFFHNIFIYNDILAIYNYVVWRANKMDKILYCRKCLEDNKKQLTNARAYAESFMYPEKYRGVVFEKEDNKICPNCKTEMTDTGLDGIKEFDRITEFGNYNADFLLAMIDLKKSDIIQYTNQMNAVNAKAEEESQKRYDEYLAKQKAEEEKSNTRHCPKCGSTNFTPVRKKYGLFMGFATNKVELVCNNCGYRMKAEN